LKRFQKQFVCVIINNNNNINNNREVFKIKLVNALHSNNKAATAIQQLHSRCEISLILIAIGKTNFWYFPLKINANVNDILCHLDFI
jgi:hypothetical protein